MAFPEDPYHQPIHQPVHGYGKPEVGRVKIQVSWRCLLKHTVLFSKIIKPRAVQYVHGLEKNIDLLVAVARWVEICLLNGH